MNENQLQIVVQAGGRGSRLRHHTWNKPKCLVSVLGKPIIYHLFDVYPSAKFVIIGDYAFDQLEIYLKVNLPHIEYELVHTDKKGTLAGIDLALEKINPKFPLLLIWSDLILRDKLIFPTKRPVIGVTSNFTCRWSISSTREIKQQATNNNGILGVFFFPAAMLLPPPPQDGEFVKWLSSNIHEFDLLDCPNVEELGDFSSIETINDRTGFCRFFNKVEIDEQHVIKTVIDPDYFELHKNEIAWYEEAKRLGFNRIPSVYSTDPLVMERIKGHHAYHMMDLTIREKKSVLMNYLDALRSLHSTCSIPSIKVEIEDVYINKTINRVLSVSKLIPGFEKSSITINGKKCRNIFNEQNKILLTSIIDKLAIVNFVPIHGDPTFSNTLVDDNLSVWFIDPRGYFSKPGIFGDARYDFAKVYYSAIGGYDYFNRRKFKLHIDEDTVEILMEEPTFAKIADDIFLDYFGKREKALIEIIHGLIWLALSGYAKDDIDSVIGSFYFGLYWFETGMNNYEID
jgi:GTP:adenosylcobinamide-phosphate guanylyltransferase